MSLDGDVHLDWMLMIVFLRNIKKKKIKAYHDKKILKRDFSPRQSIILKKFDFSDKQKQNFEFGAGVMTSL